MTRPLSLGILGSAAVVLAACGSSTSDPVVKAADASGKQPSEHMVLRSKTTSGAGTVSIAGAGDFQAKPLAAAFSATIAVGSKRESMREVVQGTAVYLSSDLFAGGFGGKHWLSLDVRRARSALGSAFGELTSQSPSDSFGQLKSNLGVTTVGPETIAGVATTHYTATIDTSRITKSLQKLGVQVGYAPVDVWVDGHGLIRREGILYTETSPAFGRSTTTVTIDYSRYGESVHVLTPPAADTFDATALTTQALKGLP